MTDENVRVGVVSLGCAKNLVDTEAMLGWLTRAGFVLTPHPEEADILIVNTCGFIQPARRESMETIREMARWKREGRCRRLVVTGCFVQRYAEELERALPEVDVLLGLDELAAIVPACRDPDFPRVLRSPRPSEWMYDFQVERVLSTPRHYAYLKIAEGCDHRCAFCAIPMIRGRYRSRSLKSITREARALASQGVKELILIAQDTSVYGRDLGLTDGLYRLLERLHAVDGIRWIRLLYLYPTTIPRDFAQRFHDFPKLVPYLDIPLQHAHPEILRAMRRPWDMRRIRRLLSKFRGTDEDFVLRTTFLVGFPGETDDHVSAMMNLMREVQFDHVGVFTYSEEKGTPAAGFEPKVDRVTAERRRAEIMTLQQEISARRLARRVGTILDVVLDETTPEPDGTWLHCGRFLGQAPEVDGVTWIRSRTRLAPGRWIRARITGYNAYDLQGEPIDVLSPSAAAQG